MYYSLPPPFCFLPWSADLHETPIPESMMRIAYNKVQKRTFFHKSLVLKRLRGSTGSRSFLARPLGFPLHMLTVITLEPIKSCPVAPPSPKGLGRGLARPLAHTPRRLARVLLLERNHRWEPKSLHQSRPPCGRISIALIVAKRKT